ncbi:hypothetical protein GCM10025866_00620 [Naasia aerilata]|uniref:Uncharacterized protein n=1 Tax=Naasia aerilata TaxID=1162966 RepID=A0ABM8G7L7_9MICO|nr:hypothetical protein GCM10025866_00620 [Naasia aerilata]
MLLEGHHPVGEHGGQLGRRAPGQRVRHDHGADMAAAELLEVLGQRRPVAAGEQRVRTVEVAVRRAGYRPGEEPPPLRSSETGVPNSASEAAY